MIQKCSLINVLNVFLRKPTNIHFIRAIGREISLAPTSVKKHIEELEKEELITKKESKPFDGYVANRDSRKFLFYKQSFNLLSLFDLKEKIIQEIHPKALILFGSYQKGEDIEQSDIDLLIITKTNKELDLKSYEKNLDRKIHVTYVKSIDELDEPLRNNIKKGLILYGELDERDN